MSKQKTVDFAVGGADDTVEVSPNGAAGGEVSSNGAGAAESVVVAKSGKVKAKLTRLADRFAGFEQQLDETKRRKQVDAEKKIQELHVEVDKLQTQITQQKKVQAESMKALQSWLEDRIDKWTTGFEAPILARLDALDKRIDETNVRIDDLDKRAFHEIAKFPGMIESRVTEIVKDFSDVDQRLEVEIKAREEKERELRLIIKADAVKLAKQLEAERLSREKRDAQLTEEIAKEVVIRSKGYEMVKKLMVEEVETLRKQIASEISEREEADEDILAALNHYVAALQDGIKLVSES